MLCEWALGPAAGSGQPTVAAAAAAAAGGCSALGFFNCTSAAVANAAGVVGQHRHRVVCWVCSEVGYCGCLDGRAVNLQCRAYPLSSLRTHQDMPADFKQWHICCERVMQGAQRCLLCPQLSESSS